MSKMLVLFSQLGRTAENVILEEDFVKGLITVGQITFTEVCNGVNLTV